MRKINFLIVFTLILICSVLPAMAMLGPSTSIMSPAIFGITGEGGSGEPETFRLTDPDSGNFFADPDSDDILAQAFIIKPNDLLSWKPLKLQNPTILTIENSDTAGYIKITKSQYPYTSPTVTETVNTATNTINFTASEDAEIWLQCDEVIENTLIIRRGRNINIIGGEIKGNIAANSSTSAVIRMAGQTKGIYIEGMVIDANNQVGLDAFEFGATAGLTPIYYANVTIQNTFVKNVAEFDSYHADCVQPYGASRSVRIDKFKGRALYQCLFFDPQHIQSGIDMRRIDLDYTNPDAAGTGYIFYLHENAPDPLSDRRRPSMAMELVHVGRRNTSYGIPEDGYWSRYSIHPRNGIDAFGFVPDIAEPNSTSATLSASFPEVRGIVFKNNPPQPFVDENAVGLNYVPIGYQ